MTMGTGGGRAAALVFALLPVACMRQISLDLPSGGGGTGSMDGGGPGGGGGLGQGGGGPSDGGPTDGATDHIRCTSGSVAPSISAKREIPAIVIALDRSSSMNKSLGTTGGSRFTVTRDALMDVMSNFNGNVTFGYVEFPGIPNDQSCDNISSCCASGVTLVKAADKLDPITKLLSSCSSQPSQVGCLTTDSTPTAQAMAHILSFNFPSNVLPRYALLITDGEPSCPLQSSPIDTPCEQTKSEIASLNFSSPAMPTFVVGVGDNIQGTMNADLSGNACLDALAQAGGVGRDAGSPFYYPAKTEDVLRTSLNDIVKGTACHIDVTEANFDPDRLEVDIDKMMVLRDLTNQDGWNFQQTRAAQPNSPAVFDPTRINLYGAACTHFITSNQIAVRSCPDLH
jgi:hypothetical protein